MLSTQVRPRIRCELRYVEGPFSACVPTDGWQHDILFVEGGNNNNSFLSNKKGEANHDQTAQCGRYISIENLIQNLQMSFSRGVAVADSSAEETRGIPNTAHYHVTAYLSISSRTPLEPTTQEKCGASEILLSPLLKRQLVARLTPPNLGRHILQMHAWCRWGLDISWWVRIPPARSASRWGRRECGIAVGGRSWAWP